MGELGGPHGMGGLMGELGGPHGMGGLMGELGGPHGMGGWDLWSHGMGGRAVCTHRRSQSWSWLPQGTA